MKIEYSVNPLATKVHLDDADKVNLLFKIRIKNLKDRLFRAHWILTEDKKQGSNRTPELLNLLDPAGYMSQEEQDGEYDDPAPVDQAQRSQVDYLVAHLLDTHIGDCTAVACSCDKCDGEGMVGIDTIPGISKHIGSALYHHFQRYGETRDGAKKVLAALWNDKVTHNYLLDHLKTNCEWGKIDPREEAHEPL